MHARLVIRPRGGAVIVLAALVASSACSHGPAPSGTASNSSGGGHAGSHAVRDVLAAADRLEGQTITVHGTARAGQTRYQGDSFSLEGQVCTELECEEGECCNRCGAAVAVADGMDAITLAGDGYACGGDSCGLTCTPAAGTAIEVTGVLRVERKRTADGDEVTYVLDVASIAP